MPKHTFANFEDTNTLKMMSTQDDLHVLSLNISYNTDSVYLYKESSAKDGTMVPVLEFTYNSSVLDIRDLDQVRCIGYLRTPPGVEFGRALMFESSKLENGKPVFTIHYNKPHVEIFLRFEEAICKMLCKDGIETLYAFLDQDWKKIKERNLHHSELIIR